MLVSNPAIQFMVYELLKRRTIAAAGENGEVNKKELMAITYFLMGALAKTVATVITYPLQLVQSKLRVSNQYSVSSQT
jgi:adenine nucleotide transporter 17